MIGHNVKNFAHIGHKDGLFLTFKVLSILDFCAVEVGLSMLSIYLGSFRDIANGLRIVVNDRKFRCPY
jgi:hypothetical protein